MKGAPRSKTNPQRMMKGVPKQKWHTIHDRRKQRAAKIDTVPDHTNKRNRE